MKKISIVSVLAFGLLTAGTAAATAAWSLTPLVPTQVEVDSSTQTFVLFPSVPASAPGCATSTYVSINLTGSADTQKALTSLAETAFLAGRGLDVHWTGSCPKGSMGEIDGLAIN